MCVCVWVWVLVSVAFTFLLDPTSRILLWQKVLQSFCGLPALVHVSPCPLLARVYSSCSLRSSWFEIMFRANSELHTVRGWQPAPFLGGGLAGEDFAGQRPASSLSVFCLFFWCWFFFNTNLITWKETRQMAFLVTLEVRPLLCRAGAAFPWQLGTVFRDLSVESSIAF